MQEINRGDCLNEGEKTPKAVEVYNAKRENWEEVSHREKEVLKIPMPL